MNCGKNEDETNHGKFLLFSFNSTLQFVEQNNADVGARTTSICGRANFLQKQFAASNAKKKRGGGLNLRNTHLERVGIFTIGVSEY